MLSADVWCAIEIARLFFAFAALAADFFAAGFFATAVYGTATLRAAFKRFHFDRRQLNHTAPRP